jgi:hypothetical protein
VSHTDVPERPPVRRRIDKSSKQAVLDQSIFSSRAPHPGALMLRFFRVWRPRSSEPTDRRHNTHRCFSRLAVAPEGGCIGDRVQLGSPPSPLPY